jgi:ABC-2 type transport system permease protein
VPFVGSPVYLMLATVLFLFSALALGLLVSTVTSTQQVAMMISLLVTLLPTVMLSGFVFPIASMPRVLQAVSSVLPATHFMVIIRGIMLKGSGPEDLAPQLGAIGAIGLAFTVVAMARFSLKLKTRGS